MGDVEEFNTLTFEKKLMQLKDTQESIQGLSSWCLKQRAHHKKIVQSWLNVLKRVKVEQRLVLFYLANDVIQYSKRKGYEFVESWGLNLQKATPLVRDDKVRPKILRIFKIWEQRSVYDDEFLSDLTGLLSAGAIKKTDDDPLDFQPQQLVNKIKQCQVLESDTDQRLKNIHDSHLELSDADALCANLKDRSHKDDVEKELNEGIACVERYTQALQREIVAREALLALLTSANQYYSTQRGEVKVVAYAYKNFGARVRALKRKLDELIPTLPTAAPSPPARDEDVPSPGPDEDIDLPAPNDSNDDDISYNIDRTFNTSFAADGSLYNLGLSSFLTSENPMGNLFNESTDTVNNSNKIEVINNRPEKQDFNINDFLKTFAPNDNAATSDNNSVTSGTMSQKSQDTLPGLDLLTPESTGNPPPPISFYGTMDQINDEPEQPYHPESNWTSNNWSIPAPPVPPISLAPPITLAPPLTIAPPISLVPPISLPVLVADTPESPPPAPVPPPEPPLYPNVQDLPSDVDHRGLLPPPPPPPIMPLLGHLEDVDHRLMPTLPSPPVPVTTSATNRPTHQDVDHRNLISLTHQPSPLQLPPAPQPPIINLDQDYRLPPPSMQPPMTQSMQPSMAQSMQPPMSQSMPPMSQSMPPMSQSMPPMIPVSDIVESVDMDLSEDEEQGMYHPDPRRQSFNNNKILVGGDNGKTQNNTNLIKINDKIDPNTYDADLPNTYNATQNFQEVIESNLEDDEYLDDLRSRGINDRQTDYEPEWQNRRPNNQRFPRNWGPRTNFNNRGFGPQFWPRNGPRPNARWMAPRQRFW